MYLSSPELIIVSGPVTSGKSSYLEKLLEKEQEKSLSAVSGIIAPGVYSNGQKNGYDAVYVSCGERFALARTDWNVPSGFKRGRFIFCPENMRKAADLISSCRMGGSVFIDEVGPLELRGEGYADAVRKIFKTGVSRAYISVREACLDRVMKEFFPFCSSPEIIEI